MKKQTYLDTRPAFQELVDAQLERLHRIEGAKKEQNAKRIAAAGEDGSPDLLPVYIVTKARLVSAAIYAAATVDLDTFAAFARKDMRKHPDLPSVAEERKLNRDVKHKLIFILPEQVDYLLLRRGELGVYHGIRLGDRELLHMAVRFFASMSDANATRYLALSERIHPRSQRHAKS